MIKDEVKFVPLKKSLLSPVLQSRIDQHFADNHKSRYLNKAMVPETIVLLSIVSIMLYVLLLALTTRLAVSFLWLRNCASTPGIRMSTMHDADRGRFTLRLWLNNLIGGTIYLADAHVENWKLQYSVPYHTYIQIADPDEDIRNRGVLKLSLDDNTAFMQRLQWMYAFHFYGDVTVYRVLMKVFFQYYRFIRSAIDRHLMAVNIRMLSRLVSMKAMYLSISFVIPVFAARIVFRQALLALLKIYVAVGLSSAAIFQLEHSVDGTNYQLMNDRGVISKDWGSCQLETAFDFSSQNKLLSWCTGRLNYRVHHHLLPEFCYVRFLELTRITRNTAEEFAENTRETEHFGRFACEYHRPETLWGN